MLAIMKRPSQTPTTAGCPPISTLPVTIASFRCVRSFRLSIFSSYPLKSRGLAKSISLSHSSNVPSSAIISIRRYACTLKYPWHFGQI